ncbi:GNAT family N-acetyltransferase [Microbacterium sp. ARD31]|jgi:RimJ/RimL family protein N-acetyltransferase|uniref:GNAT family N-acetyltransferase n=1 Tax=Microbacterium sp. ARD31 TaxID=2962576 RepID=UPI002881A851|nr:GNAT family N-acetyltransferase [Microbacterium sp. ARD31]MDT0186396.1 GNAT family N-acetyltransferase [Microbacterium sp. ARD31]
MTDWRHVRTERLWLDEPTDGDAEALFSIHSDPASWVHFPSGRVTDPAAGAVMVSASTARFARDGLAYWSVRDQEGGPVVGRGGCMGPDDGPWWNLYYRFDQRVVGRGYATEMGEAAIAAAHDVAPDRPVLAYLLEHNHGSRRTAEKLGLRLVWRGPDEGNPDPDAVRLVFLDRAPDDALVRSLEAAGMPARHLVAG